MERTTTSQVTSRETVLVALEANPGATAAEVSEAAGIGRSTASRVLAKLHRDGQVTRDASGNGRRVARWALPEPTATSTAEAGAGVRLRKGQLGVAVAEYLAAHPDEVVSPRQVAQALGGRSPGAVGNALTRLVTTGVARLVSTSPLRYQAGGQAL